MIQTILGYTNSKTTEISPMNRHEPSQTPLTSSIEKGTDMENKPIQRLLRQIRHDSAVAAVCFAIAFSTTTLRADNQIIPGNFGTSDPAPMVDGNTLYLYHTVDAIGNGDLSIYDIQVHSTTDLMKWKDEGVALTEKNVPWAAQKGNLWAPHAIKLGGKYHLYFPANDGNVFRMGHAVSDKPTGPFIADKTFMSGCGVDPIDPFVYYDSTTNKAYLAWNQVGSTPNPAFIAELNSAFTDVTGTVTNFRAGLGGNSQRYIEGIWIIKQNNLYYNIVADWTGSVESITYSTSSNLRGPYTYKGEILNMNTNSSTIHAGAVFFRNRWLIFYHTGGAEFGGTINTGTKRVTGIEYMDFNTTASTWTIPAVQKTFRGVGIPMSHDTIQIDRHSPSGISGARVSVVGGNEPRGWMVSGISNNGYIRYNDVDFSSTDKSSGEIRMRVASVSAGGSIEVRADTQTGPLLGTVAVPATGGLTTWMTVTAPVSTAAPVPTGIKNLVLVFKTTAANQFNVNWVSVGRPLTTAIQPRGTNAATRTDIRMQRLDKNLFQVEIAEAAGVPICRVLNIKGQEMTNAFVLEPSVRGNFNMKFEKNRLSSGVYVLSVKTDAGHFQTPFVF